MGAPLITLEALRLARECLIGFGLLTGARATNRPQPREDDSWGVFGTSEVCSITRRTINLGGRPIDLATGRSTRTPNGVEHAIFPRELRRLQDLLGVPEALRAPPPVGTFVDHTYGRPVLGRIGDPENQQQNSR